MSKRNSRCGSAIIRVWLGFVCCLAAVLGIAGCKRIASPKEKHPLVLTMMGSGENGLDQTFTNSELRGYERQTGVQVRNLVGYDTIDQRLRFFENLFERKSHDPDLCKIDTIWPGALADHLLDLRPYVGEELKTISPQLWDYFTVNGKLLGLPLITDTAVLYYRTDLLRKYGYRAPPRTWDELGRMAAVIQNGERKRGNKDFWGYVWQGVLAEALTCNALEWQMAEGGGDILSQDGRVTVNNENSRRALARAASWVGTISPASVVEYDEDDSQYLWNTGNAAFFRAWLDGYQLSRQPSSLVRDRFGVAPLPGGKSGRGWVFGGMALAVSKYSQHPKEALDVIRFLASAEVQRRRTQVLGEAPTRTSLLNDSNLMSSTALRDRSLRNWQDGMFARPSNVAGKNYDAVSQAYAEAVHRTLERQAKPDQALADLQAELERQFRRP